MKWSLKFDGGATPNPGKASCAFSAVCLVTGEEVKKAWPMKGKRTNNEAEWEAMVVGIESLLEEKKSKVTEIRISGDSELVIEQISGGYKVKSEKLKPYYRKWCKIKKDHPEVRFRFKHVWREWNEEMDRACKDVRF
jgi:ribonuclease HI